MSVRDSHTLQCYIVDTCVSVCFQLYSLPKQWGGICHVAQKDIPEGSRCSFIKLSYSVEQRKGTGKQRKKGRDREKYIKECNAGGRKGGRCGRELDGCGGEKGGSLGTHARHPHNGFPAICISEC